MQLIFFSILYALSYILSSCGAYYASGSLLIAAAAGLSVYYYKKSGRLTCPAVIFSLSWIGGCGISCLKLSRLQTDWEPVTWICFYLVYMLFVSAYSMADRVIRRHTPFLKREISLKGLTGRACQEQTGDSICGRLLRVMRICTAVSALAFISEALLLGYIPLLTEDTPHAYSYFHVSGLHYFTVTCVLLPAMFVLYVCCISEGFSKGLSGCIKDSRTKAAAAAICASAGVIIPVLLVSRYQLLFGIMLASSVFIILRGGRIVLSLKTAAAAAICLAAVVLLYVFITVERAHSVEYLNGIFEMKDSSTPIWVTQPYMYIANNFDNFNCMVRDITKHSHGLKMLFPVIALTGLKFIRPELTAFPLFVTKEELTTVTLFYDAYYDFGIAGVVCFALVLGAAYAAAEHICVSGIEKGTSGRGLSVSAAGITGVLLYGQLCIYLALSFFTTWFSNPTTWFYFAVTALCGIVLLFKSGG